LQAHPAFFIKGLTLSYLNYWKPDNMTFACEPLISAIIFDLDGVLTDTAEYHFRAWKRLADEEGIPFTREDNEKLRGVSRRRSLEIILDGREVPEDEFQAMMDRKNGYYQGFLNGISPDDLLPGVDALLDDVRRAGLKIAVASASRNAATVVDNLKLRDRIDALADGHSPGRPKPAPDLFLHAAHLLDLPPTCCVVVEDAEAGIAGGVAAGMVTVGIGPESRVGRADLVLPDLDGVKAADLVYPATWRVSEPEFDPAQQHVAETILAQGNGYLGTRATFEEGFTGQTRATLVHNVWDDVPLFFTELVNAPDWTVVEVFVNGVRFDMAREGISDYSRTLDLRTGTLHRRLRWQVSAEGPTVDLTFERVSDLGDPHLLGVRVRVEALDEPVEVEVCATLDGNVENQGILQEGTTHWELLSQRAEANEAALHVATRHTREGLAMVMRLDTESPLTGREASRCKRNPGVSIQARIEAGEALTADKLVAVHTTDTADDPLAAARRRLGETSDGGYDDLRERNKAAWAAFWRDGDVIIEGDDAAQVALRHALFQMRAAVPTFDERTSIGAKGLSGYGYRGHIFWDAETYILPFFTYTQPALARNMLMYRWHTLDGARRNATRTNCRGARYAWESAQTGDEVTPTHIPDFKQRGRLIRVWSGDIEYHVTADIAHALWQHWRVTGDDGFMQDVGVPILLETAVFWEDFVRKEDDHYVLRDVLGPDEYHEHVNNNVFTNRMVAWHLRMAGEMFGWLGDRAPEAAAAWADELGIDDGRLDHWREIADHLVILYDPDTGLMEQFEGFFDLKEFDWEGHKDRNQSVQAILGIEQTYEYQAAKQADVVLLLCLLNDEYDRRTVEVNYDYYTPRTDLTEGSSLGPPVYAWAACMAGRPDEAYEHFMTAARIDLWDRRGDVSEGMHIASAGGLWQAVVFGFAGLRLTADGSYTLNPRLPSGWRRLAFSFYLGDERIAVDLGPDGG
jgi:beta-phosphoglucomutase